MSTESFEYFPCVNHEKPLVRWAKKKGVFVVVVVKLDLIWKYRILRSDLPQFSDRLNANAPSGLAPAAKPLRVSLADYAAGGQYV